MPAIRQWFLPVLLVAVGCYRQHGYTHGPEEFTDDDRWALGMVQKSPLGKPEIMRAVVSGMVDSAGDAGPLLPCRYLISKVIDWKGPKNRDGTREEYYRVECLTAINPQLPISFIWQVHEGYGVTGFTWGWVDISDLPRRPRPTGNHPL